MWFLRSLHVLALLINVFDRSFVFDPGFALRSPSAWSSHPLANYQCAPRIFNPSRETSTRSIFILVPCGFLKFSPNLISHSAVCSRSVIAEVFRFYFFLPLLLLVVHLVYKIFREILFVRNKFLFGSPIVIFWFWRVVHLRMHTYLFVAATWSIRTLHSQHRYVSNLSPLLPPPLTVAPNDSILIISVGLFV